MSYKSCSVRTTDTEVLLAKFAPSPFSIKLDALHPRKFWFIRPPVVEVTGSSWEGDQLALVRKPKLPIFMHDAQEKPSKSDGKKEKASPQGVHDGYLTYNVDLRCI